MGRFRLTDENDNLTSLFKFAFFIINILLFVSWLFFKNLTLLFFIIDIALIIIIFIVYFSVYVIDLIKDKIQDNKLVKSIGWKNFKKQKLEEGKKIVEEIEKDFKKHGINGIDDLNNYIDNDENNSKAAFKRLFD